MNTEEQEILRLAEEIKAKYPKIQNNVFQRKRKLEKTENEEMANTKKLYFKEKFPEFKLKIDSFNTQIATEEEKIKQIQNKIKEIQILKHICEKEFQQYCVHEYGSIYKICYDTYRKCKYCEHELCC